MGYIGTTNLTITMLFTQNVHTLWLQLAHFSPLPLKFSRGRRHRVVKTAVEWEH